MMRPLIIATVMCSCLPLALAEPAGVTERDYAHYRALQKAGLADLAMDMTRSDITRFEMAVIVGGAIDRVKAHAWNDAATDTQKVEALQALQQLIADCKADLQKLGISVKNSVALILVELRGLRPEAVSSKPPRDVEPTNPGRRETTNARMSDPNKPGSKVMSLASLDLSPMTNGAKATVTSLLAHTLPTGSITLDMSGGPTNAFSITNAHWVGRSFEVAAAIAQGRDVGFPDARAAKVAATLNPGPFTLSGAISSSGRSPLVNAMSGMSPQMMPYTTAFGGDVMLRGPLGLRFGGGLEGVRSQDIDTLGRYNAMVGFERMGEKLSLSLDLKRSVFFYDPNTAIYSAGLGLGYNPSRSVALQLRYQRYQDDFRAFGLRDSGFQNFVAGQVAVRW